MVASRVASLLGELRADGAKIIVIASPQAVLDALAAQPAGSVALIGLEAPIAQAGAACGGGAVAAVVVEGGVRPRTFGQALRRARGASAIHLEQWPLDDADAVAARVPALIAAGVGALALTSPALSRLRPAIERATRRRAAGSRGGRRRGPARPAHAAARGPARAPPPPGPSDRDLEQPLASRRPAQRLSALRLVGQRVARQQRPQLAQAGAAAHFAAAPQGARRLGCVGREPAEVAGHALAGGTRLVGLAGGQEREIEREQRERKALEREDGLVAPLELCTPLARRRALGVVHDRAGHVQAAVTGQRGAQIEVDVLP